MLSATFTSRIITHYKSALASYVILTDFIPMFMDTASNAGSQTSVTIIRGISLNKIKFKDLFKILWKKFRVVPLVGIVLGIANFIKLILVNHVSLEIATIVCSPLFFTIIFAKILGGLLPLLVKKLGIDPTVMASPLITTIVDAASLIIYFNIASWLLPL